MNTQTIDIRDLLESGELSQREAKTELWEVWPAFEGIPPGVATALVVLRFLMTAVPLEYHSKQLTTDQERKNVLLEVAWIRVKDMTPDARKEVVQKLKSFSGQSFVEIMESDIMHQTFWCREAYCAVQDLCIKQGENVVSAQLSPAQLAARSMVHYRDQEEADLTSQVQRQLCRVSHSPDFELPLARVPAVLQVLYKPVHTEEADAEKFTLMANICPTFYNCRRANGETQASFINLGAYEFGLAAVVKLGDPDAAGSRDAVRLYFPDGKPIRPPFAAKELVGKEHDLVQLGWTMGSPPDSYMLYYTRLHSGRLGSLAEEVEMGPAEVEAEAAYLEAFMEHSAFAKARPDVPQGAGSSRNAFSDANSTPVNESRKQIRKAKLANFSSDQEIPDSQ
ncbi:hypothetical protein MCOR31_011321 [Pyricularia oryzae]|nr:hypothetical protein MCOR31_011321 [Pyricularia oryzae]KAI6384866.1 hypothetical protein MCOR24_011557 [Pyricularia oryzae]